MARRWTIQEDTFLFAYFEAVGDFIGEHDLGRPKGAATARVRHLKRTGAWAAMERMRQAESDYYKCLGMPSLDDLPPGAWIEGDDFQARAAA